MNQEEIINGIRILLDAPFKIENEVEERFYKAIDDWELPWEYSDIVFDNDTIMALHLLLEKCRTEKNKEIFWTFLSNKYLYSEELSMEGESIRIHIDYVIMFFIRLGRFKEISEYFMKQDNVYNKNLQKVLRVVNALIKYEPNMISVESLTRLEKDIKCLSERHKKRINKDRSQGMITGYWDEDPELYLFEELEWNIKKTKRDDFLNKLKQINPAINSDKKVLKEKMAKFRFNKDLEDCLEQADIELEKVERKQSFNYKNCIGHVRSFIEKLTISIALRIEQKTNIKHSELIDKMGRARAYLRKRDIKFLSEKQDEFLGALYALASDENTGTHSLTSDREHARILKNTAIEQGLFLIQLLEKYLSCLGKR